MPDEKIHVSWSEIASADVDAKLKQQDAMGRAQRHYQQQPQPPVSGAMPATIARPKISVWYRTTVYMALFGLVGGLCAGGLGEIAWRTNPSRRFEFNDLIQRARWIEALRKRGEISDAQATAAYSELEREGKDNPYIKIYNSPSSDDEKRRQAEALESRDEWTEFFAKLAFWGICGTMIAFWLGIAEPAVSRNSRSAVIQGATGAMVGLAGGAIVSFFIDKLYQAIGGGRLDGSIGFGSQIVARALGWAVVGLFLAIAPGIVLRDWKRLFIGLAGGMIGGFLGGLLFDPIDRWTNSDTLSRLIGLLGIGILIGVGTGLIENAAKTGWFRVVAGLLAGKQFILYRNPTVIGSSPLCEIYLSKDVQVAPQHAAIRIVPGGFEIEDLRSASGTFVNGQKVSRRRLNTGDQIAIGSTAFAFGERRQNIEA